jgi:Secretion system C-terminal sorting domain
LKSVINILTLLVSLSTLCYSQDITFIAEKVLIQDTLGKEIVFNCKIKNISAMQQTVFMVRTKNTLPANWISSLCFGDKCFPGTLDSVATTIEFDITPFSPQEERDASLHVFTSNLTKGVAYVSVEAGTAKNPISRVALDFTAEANPTSVNDKNSTINNYNLDQNYPNPFNPDTKISYQLKDKGYVKLVIYDIRGDLLKVLVNETKEPGSYEIDFNAKGLTSGIYFYRIEVIGKGSIPVFSDIKKTILLK